MARKCDYKTNFIKHVVELRKLYITYLFKTPGVRIQKVAAPLTRSFFAKSILILTPSTRFK